MLVYIYNFIRFGANATVTYSVSFSLFAVVMFASIFGTLVPMTLEKLKIDPAIATGPFISITNDIIGMMLYMGITVLLSWYISSQMIQTATYTKKKKQIHTDDFKKSQ